jgi:integrating conjugative element protein (TIGR03757 family)
MPTTEAEAKAYFNQNYPALMKRFKPLIRNAADGLNLAMQYQIDHLPAVVINQRSVVFGVASVDQAIAEYLDHEATKAKRNLTFLPSVPPVPWK